MDITARHLEIVRHPRFGYGENMNPCIDCHTLMVRIAGEMLESEHAAFIITGEVLGQRPMSQNRKSLDLVAEESGLKDLLLRPLSAKCLTPTLPETEGWVNREQLMGINGRSRKPQMEMAQQLHIDDYPSPAGGCMLTEKGFSRRLRDLLSSKKDIERNDLELLKLGRHFRVTPETKVVVGRNRQENMKINRLSRHEDTLLNAMSVPGPTVLVSGELSEEALNLGAAIATAYSDTPDRGINEVRMVNPTETRVLTTEIRDKSDFRCYMI
ncbi:MAG: tRNA 4-thiouridine(8) synthase ThiI [Deltaproteobacteria bacterium]|nr:tRNA 4-thiouridine(8) synthase ThiI [Deltaproteobacteria bacterium]